SARWTRARTSQRDVPTTLNMLRLLGLVLLLSAAPLRGATLAEAVDATNLVWTTGGNAAWTAQTNTTHDGLDTAPHGPLATAAGLYSWLQTTVNGPGPAAFWWKVSGGCCGSLDFLVGAPGFPVGDELKASINGEQDWRRGVLPVPAGSQALQWRYGKFTA